MLAMQNISTEQLSIVSPQRIKETTAPSIIMMKGV